MSINSSEGSGKVQTKLTDSVSDKESDVWDEEMDVEPTKKNSRGTKRNHWLPEVSSFFDN
jgi:hypothetical protein